MGPQGEAIYVSATFSPTDHTCNSAHASDSFSVSLTSRGTMLGVPTCIAIQRWEEADHTNV
jgi:hypothetical protein